METARQLLRTWREAADDLGIEVEPFGDAVLVLGFGSAAGLLCAVPETREGELGLRRQAEARGAGWSVLGASYLSYDRHEFIAMLNDWGWCGDGAPPPWFTHEPWTT